MDDLFSVSAPVMYYYGRLKAEEEEIIFGKLLPDLMTSSKR
jgi:hypothetical protein